MTRPRRTAAIVLATAAAALTMAACGGSTPRHHAGSDPLLARSQCMRAHGAPNFPDPIKANGSEGFPGTVRQADGSMTIEGTAAHGSALSEHQKESFVAQARCIRTHGVPNFPDPRFGPRGWGVSVPLKAGQDPDSPAILKAEKTCASVGTPLPGV